MQAAASALPRHPNPRRRVSYRPSLLGWDLREFRLRELRLRQASCLPEACLERPNQALVRFQVHRGIRRRILNLTSQHRSHRVCSSVIRTADLANRLAPTARSYHAPRESRARHRQRRTDQHDEAESEHKGAVDQDFQRSGCVRIYSGRDAKSSKRNFVRLHSMDGLSG